MKSTNIFRTLAALACLCSISAALLAGCGKQGSSGAAGVDEECPQNGFIATRGSLMAASPDGYYVLRPKMDADGNPLGDYLYYITPDFEKSTILCGKPDCMHDKNQATDWNELYKCDAFFPVGAEGVAFYDGHLYVCAQSEDSIITSTVYKLNPDGTGRTVFCKPDGNVNGWFIYDGNMYIAVTAYKAPEGDFKGGNLTKEVFLQKVSMKKPQNPQTIYSTNEFPVASLNRLQYHDGFAYFFFTGEEDRGMCHFRVDLETGREELLYECENSADSAILYVNDYGCVVNEESLASRNDEGEVFMKTALYKLNPGGSPQQLTEKDFPVISPNIGLEAMDEEYLYFIPNGNFTLKEESWPADTSITVCKYNGEIAATIPLNRADLAGSLYDILPGTKDYMFLVIEGRRGEMRWFRAPKSEFDGGTVQIKEIPLE